MLWNNACGYGHCALLLRVSIDYDSWGWPGLGCTLVIWYCKCITKVFHYNIADDGFTSQNLQSMTSTAHENVSMLVV
jgi:hypothetical protein